MMSIPMEGVFMSGTHPMLLSALIVIGLGQFGLSAKADDRRSVATMQAGCGYAAYNPAPDLRRTSMRNLAEYLIRQWAPLPPKKVNRSRD